MLSRKKDIKHYDRHSYSSYFGESRYDPEIITGNYCLMWEEAYYQDLHFRAYRTADNWGSRTKEQYLAAAKLLEDLLNLSQVEIDSAKKVAKERAERGIDDWNSTINNYRKSGYAEERKKHLIYSIIICFALTILGRYLIKLIKWVQKNQSK